MNEIEAKSILGQELTHYRGRSYSEILSLVDRSETFERTSPSGVIYQLEMQVFIDDESQGTLRVRGATDDGGWRALRPVCEDFIMTSDGSFAGE